jgi:hypothetical protein
LCIDMLRVSLIRVDKLLPYSLAVSDRNFASHA